jgi:hypothetical protein
MLQTPASKMDQTAKKPGVTLDEDNTTDALAYIVDNQLKLKAEHDCTVVNGSGLNVLKQGDVAGTLPQVDTTNQKLSIVSEHDNVTQDT